MTAAQDWLGSLWVPLVLMAAAAQTVRNAAQKTLTTEAGILGATLTRFLYGLPFAALWLAVVGTLTDVGPLPALSTRYLLWMLLGAGAQVLATMFLLAAMRARSFLVAVTLSKTEVIQVAVLGAFVLSEVPPASVIWGMLAALAGTVMLFSIGARRGGQVPLAGSAAAATYGLAAGLAFAVATIAYRTAGLDLVETSGLSVLYVGALNVLVAQLAQSSALIGVLAATQPRSLLAVLNAWRVSVAAGAAGAIASIGWFTAYILKPAAEVKTLGMIEIVMSYCVGRYLFKERLSASEAIALLTISLGALAACIAR